jgi:cytoskeletal protein CcmA (bactofilin family)
MQTPAKHTSVFNTTIHFAINCGITLAAILVLFVLVVPNAYAAVVRGGDQYTLDTDVVLEDDLYLGGQDISLLGDISGDVFAAAAGLEMGGVVREDLNAIAGTLVIEGAVEGDARLIGGEVFVDAEISEDLVIIGGTVYLYASTTIAGDLLVLADRLVIEAEVQGAAELYASTIEIRNSTLGDVRASVGESLTLQTGTSILGDVTYRAPREAFITDDVEIGGDVSYEHMDMNGPSDTEAGIIGFFVRVLITLIAGVVLLAVDPNPRCRSPLYGTRYTTGDFRTWYICCRPNTRQGSHGSHCRSSIVYMVC